MRSKRDELLVPLDTLSRLIGLQPSRLRAVRARMGHAHERKVDGRVAVDLLGWLPAWLSQRDDPRISEQKIRLLRAQADRMELALARDRGEVLTVGEAENLHGGWFQEAIRKAHGRLCSECANKVSDSLDQARREVEGRYIPAAGDCVGFSGKVQANGKPAAKQRVIPSTVRAGF